MKQSMIRRIEAIELKQLPRKPCLILKPGEPEPENPEDYFKVIQIRAIDLSNYLEPDTPKSPFCHI